LATLTIEECVASVVDQVEQAGLDEVVLVGHSLAGISIPGVATRLGARRVRHLVMVACCIPPQGASVIDTLYGPLRLYARSAARTSSASKPLPRFLASQLFCNGMTREQKAFALNQLCNEAMRLNSETVDRSALPAQIKRTWVLTLRDRALRPSQQRRFAENLGGVDEVVEIDACHDVMVSRPAELATVLARAARPARLPPASEGGILDEPYLTENPASTGNVTPVTYPPERPQR
jgi:pimeloyl-ACP methyl ester carboxylesterase